MPPPIAQQSVLRFPLSAIFATEGNVRVLREMLSHGSELSAPAIAERVGLSRQHVLRIVSGLADLGIIEAVGVGRHPTYRGHRAHPLYDSIVKLFRAEEERFRRVRDAILAATTTEPLVESVWLYGSVARGEDRVRSDVDVAVVIGAEDIDRVTDEIRNRLRAAEEALGFNTSIVGLGPADVLRLRVGDPWWAAVTRDAITIHGPTPERLATRLARARNNQANSAERL